jgi:hypothetical protein
MVWCRPQETPCDQSIILRRQLRNRHDDKLSEGHGGSQRETWAERELLASNNSDTFHNKTLPY